MPVTLLEPSTALVLIDLQRGITAMPTVHSAEAVVERAARLVAAWHAHRQPVIAVRVAFSADGGDRLRNRTDAPAPGGTPPADFAELRPELQLAAGDIVITKHGWNAFYGTDLDLQLRRRAVTGVVLAGISTSIGVESTARAAAERNYHVAFAVDAMTDLVAGAHTNSVGVIFPRLGQVDTTERILAVLEAQRTSA